MQPYNPASKCPKCGHDKVETSYRSTNVMERRCERCTYDWPERPLDQPDTVDLVHSLKIAGVETTAKLESIADATPRS